MNFERISGSIHHQKGTFSYFDDGDYDEGGERIDFDGGVKAFCYC